MSKIIAFATVAGIMCASPSLADDVAAIQEANRQEVLRVMKALQAGSQGQKSPGDAIFIAKAKATASAQMKDPESAKFRSLIVHHASQISYVCGEINAKNSFGGYVGYRRFLTDGADMTVMDGDPHFTFALLAASLMDQNTAESTPDPAITILCSAKPPKTE